MYTKGRGEGLGLDRLVLDLGVGRDDCGRMLVGPVHKRADVKAFGVILGRFQETEAVAGFSLN